MILPVNPMNIIEPKGITSQVRKVSIDNMLVNKHKVVRNIHSKRDNQNLFFFLRSSFCISIFSVTFSLARAFFVVHYC